METEALGPYGRIWKMAEELGESGEWSEYAKMDMASGKPSSPSSAAEKAMSKKKKRKQRKRRRGYVPHKDVGPSLSHNDGYVSEEEFATHADQTNYYSLECLLKKMGWTLWDLKQEHILASQTRRGYISLWMDREDAEEEMWKRMFASALGRIINKYQKKRKMERQRKRRSIPNSFISMPTSRTASTQCAGNQPKTTLT